MVINRKLMLRLLDAFLVSLLITLLASTGFIDVVKENIKNVKYYL